MKKTLVVASAVALMAIGSAQAQLSLSGSTGTIHGDGAFSADTLSINWTVVQLAAGDLYTYTYVLTTSPNEPLFFFTIGNPADPVFDTAGITITQGTGSAAGGVVGWSLGGGSGATVAFTSPYGPGSTVWATIDGSIDWNNPPFIPAPVPEASTVLAGLLMVVPLGIGAIRSIRKDRVA